MKKIIGVISVIFLLIGCQNDSDVDIRPSITSDQELAKTYSFSRDEIRSLVCEKMGCQDLTFDEEAKFLMEYISNTLVNKRNEGYSGRTSSSYTSVLCTAGIYYGSSGQWIFNTKSGSITQFIQAKKTDRVGSPQTIGASASVYGGDDPYYYDLLSIYTINPTYLDCGGDDIKGLANAFWSTATGAQSYSDVQCDD